jgi:hypothetical protein
LRDGSWCAPSQAEGRSLAGPGSARPEEVAEVAEEVVAEEVAAEEVAAVAEEVAEEVAAVAEEAEAVASGRGRRCRSRGSYPQRRAGPRAR